MKKSIIMMFLLLLTFVSLANAREYTVKPGDSLSLIGQTAGVPWRRIAEVNSISSPYVIRVGDKLHIPEKKNGRIDTLGDRIDAMVKLTHRQRISGDANKRVDVLYGSLDVFPVKIDDHYIGLGGTYIGVDGKTQKGYSFDADMWFVGPQYKWLPQNGHEFGAGIGFGAKKDGAADKSRSAEMFEVHYTNTERKLAGKSVFSEWTAWGSLTTSDKNSFSVGGRLYIYDGEDFRTFADVNANFDDPNSAVAVGVGVTDRRNIVEVGAGIRVGTQGVEWWVGPAVKPDNLLNGVTLKPAMETVNVSEEGITPIAIASIDSNVGSAKPITFQPDYSHLGM